MTGYSAEQLSTLHFIDPTVKLGPYTFTDGRIRFDFNRDNVDFRTLTMYADVYASNATSSFPETCGSASLFRKMAFTAGGLEVDSILEYPAYVANRMMSSQDYGSDPSRNGGHSALYGRGATLGSGTGNSVVYKIPLHFSFIDDGHKFHMDQFNGKTFIQVDLADDESALFDSAGAATYTIKRIWIQYHDFRNEDVVELVSGDIINVNCVESITDIAKVSGTLVFPLEASNVTKIMVNMNADLTGYVTATDDKFRSNITDVTDMSIRLRGRHYPRNKVGYRDFGSEAYEMSFLAAKNGANVNHLHGGFINYSDFIGAANHGFITFPMFGRVPKRDHEGGLGRIHGGSYLSGQDALYYTQSAASGYVLVFIEFTKKLTFTNGRLTARKSQF